MAADRYRSAEDKYYKLRGQFDTGRITQEQFDERLRELMIQDDRGRYWMLGADSGKWYYYDGSSWVPGDPLDGAAAAAAAATAAAAESAAPTPAAGTGVAPRPAPQAPPEKAGRDFPFVPIVIGAALLVGALAAFLLFQNRERLFVAQVQPTPITPVLPATITRAPSPTPRNGQATSVATAADLPTPIPITEAPNQPTAAELPTLAAVTAAPPTVGITVAADTPEPTNAGELPTLLPSVTSAATEAIPTVTPLPATATNTPPPNTATPSFPPGVYVTALNISPSPARQNQAASFTATFVNTTGGAQPFNWLILVYRAETGNQFGESTGYLVNVPVGESTLTIEHTPVTGRGGGCEPFFARAGWKTSSVEKTVFPNTSGAPVTVNFESCPAS
jgi:hypothetical protein